MAEKETAEPAGETTGARESIWDTGEVSKVFNVEMTDVAQVLGYPELEEASRRIGQEFRDQQRPRAAARQ